MESFSQPKKGINSPSKDVKRWTNIDSLVRKKKEELGIKKTRLDKNSIQALQVENHKMKQLLAEQRKVIRKLRSEKAATHKEIKEYQLNEKKYKSTVS